MREVIERVLEARTRACEGGGRAPPLLVKVGPDLDDAAISDIAEVALETKIDGLIVGNTTLDRPRDAASPHRTRPADCRDCRCCPRPTRVSPKCIAVVGGPLPLIGCGGVASGAHAYAKIRAGASLVQLYSALVYHGPELITQIKGDLAGRLHADGFKSVTAAVGADTR